MANKSYSKNSKNIFKTIKKVILSVFLLMIILFGAAIATFAIVVNTNNSVHKSEEITMSSKSSSNRKALVIYQPAILGSVTKDIAKNIAKGINDNNYEVTINHPGDYVSKDVSKYSIIVFGSPVYLGNMSTALTKYIQSVSSFNDKKVILFCTGSAKLQEEFDSTKASFSGVKSIQKIKFITSDKNLDKEAYDIGKKQSQD